MQNESMISFVENFFSIVGAKIEKSGDNLIITQVPKDISLFLSKSEPYILSFNTNDVLQGAEVITQGSFFLNKINDYLRQKGKTSLLKIDLPSNQENVTFPVVLKEGELFKQDKSELTQYFLRFSFMTVFQYLNEREQIVTDLLIKDNQIYNLDLENYKISEGSLNEFNLGNIKSDYLTAKNKLQELLSKKIEVLSNNLDEKLAKEIDRINNHYIQERKELEENLKKLEKSFLNAEKEDAKKAKKIKEEIELLQSDLKNSNKQLEKDFFIQDEKNKHALNISTKLINTSVICFPVYRYNLYIRNSSINRSFEVTFDPLKKEFSKINCNSCNSNLSELYLCAQGHLSCKSCVLSRCGDCSNVLCKKCSTKNCAFCIKNLCRKCEKSCSECSKKVCSSHLRKESISDKSLCFNCSAYCANCSKILSKSRIRNNNGKLVCESCYRLDSISKKLK